MKTLRRNANLLRRLRFGEILKAIDSASALWKDPAYPLRRMAEEHLPSFSRFSREMTAEGIRLIFKNLSGEYLYQNMKNEIGIPECIDTFTEIEGTRHGIAGHELTGLVCAGNIPGVSLVSLAQALLLKSSVLVRTSSADPLLPVLFAHSLMEIDEDIGNSLAVFWWDRADSTLMETVLRNCDSVIAYGSDETLNSLRKKTDKPFLGYGHKISFSLVTRESLAEPAGVATNVARDVSLFDQHGCLSPHVVYVEEGGAIRPEDFAAELARAMEKFNESFPLGKLAPGEAGQIMQIRGAAEFQEIAKKGVKIWMPEEGIRWTVIFDSNPAFVLSCLNRTIWVKPLKEITALKGLLSPWRQYLQTAGVASPKERIDEIAGILRETGVNRICPAGAMQEPGPGWHHDGMNSLARIIRWIDIEGFFDE